MENTVRELHEEFKGFRVTGRAIGDKPPYQAAGRVQRDFDPLGWGSIDQPIELSDEFETEREAAEAGLNAAKLWVINNPDAHPRKAWSRDH